jgi:hypothetical protein
VDGDPETLAGNAATRGLDEIRSLGPERIDHHEFVETAAHAHQGERGGERNHQQHDRPFSGFNYLYYKDI